jgi:hypothetical protein
MRKLGERQLRDVPLAKAGEAEEDLLDRQRERGQLDALHRHATEHDVPDVIGFVDGECEAQWRHQANRMCTFLSSV